ncbi:hypothetical protein IFM89_036061 [Coptis chinensis]|uniref:Uncharacterized protein n=1 Tax=Coptis chinensis TaxID=261450 RepID=A0A835LGU0_9MAGN|nr:hypothetical protein IFM89_036061 [Coptis chinensis]
MDLTRSKQSDAVKEATKAICTPDADETSTKGKYLLKQMQEKSKNKGKKEKNTTQLKTSGDNEHILHDQITKEQVHMASDAHPDMENVGTSGGDDLKEKAEEVDEMTRKLEEQLEYQTQFENDAKQKAIARQRKATSEATAEGEEAEKDFSGKQ